MARWLVQLQGDPFDLAEFPRWFPTGAVHAVEDESGVFLIGPALDELATPAEVHEAALQALDEFTGVVALIEPAIGRPEAVTVWRAEDDGTRKASAFMTAAIVGRSRLRAQCTISGAVQAAPVPTQAQILLAGSRANDHLSTAVMLWAHTLKTWPRLYRILEEIEQHLGSRVDQAGLTSKAERTRFTQTANVAEVAGADSRHALGKFGKPARPMDRAGATEFIGKLLREVLTRAGAGPPPPP